MRENKKRCRDASFLCVLFLLSATCFSKAAEISPPSSLLKTGDLICRHGNGLWSEFFRKASPNDKRFSHIGIVSISPSGIWVIHAEANDLTGIGKVKRETLSNFSKGSSSIGVFRLRNINPSLFVEAAGKRLGTPFDWKFDTGTESALYCTELVDVALRDSNASVKIPRETIHGLIIIPIDSCISPKHADTIFIEQRT